MPFDLIVVDLDNTLYAADCGVFANMDKRMTAYVSRELGVDESRANELRIDYWRRYGTTLRGLILHHGMEPEGFLHEVHDIPVHDMLKPDAALAAALAKLPGRKVIHTNGTREHAERVLDALGIAQYFSKIYDIRFNGYMPKPCGTTLGFLLAAEGVKAASTLVVDDMEDNLAAARAIDANTALVSPVPSHVDWDFQAPNFADLCRMLVQEDVQ
jgi:putative hydrolase of the HAD superfamily